MAGAVDGLQGQAPLAGASRGLWLFGQRHDLAWSWVAALVPLAVYLPPYLLWGSAAVWPLYLVYVAAFAIPHTWLTFAVMATPSGHRHYSRQSLWWPLAMTMGVVVAFPLAAWWGPWAWDAFFTATVLIGYHHVWKQHLGLWKLYDRQLLAQAEPGAKRSLTALRWAATWGFLAPVVYAWGQPVVHVKIDRQAFHLLHPLLPEAAWSWWVGACALVAALALLSYRPGRPGRPWPVGQLSLLAVGGLSYGVAFGAVAPKDFLLSVAIFITAHDLQYGGFVWGFQQRRAQAKAQAGEGLDRIHRWALAGRWAPYFALCFVFSALLVGVISAAPEGLAFVVVIAHNHLHYFLDRFAWRREHNPALGHHMAGAMA